MIDLPATFTRRPHHLYVFASKWKASQAAGVWFQLRELWVNAFSSTVNLAPSQKLLGQAWRNMKDFPLEREMVKPLCRAVGEQFPIFQTIHQTSKLFLEIGRASATRNTETDCLSRT